jgi:hypothetical protein
VVRKPLPQVISLLGSAELCPLLPLCGIWEEGM